MNNELTRYLITFAGLFLPKKVYKMNEIITKVDELAKESESMKKLQEDFYEKTTKSLIKAMKQDRTMEIIGSIVKLLILLSILVFALVYTYKFIFKQ